MDMDTGQRLAVKNADRRFIPASVTKVMTLFVAFEMLNEGTLSLGETIRMRDDTQQDWFRKGSTMRIAPGQAVPVPALLTGIAAISANDGSVALAEGAAGSVSLWTARMNAAARDLGMRNSHFATPNGWPDQGQTFTTADDLVRLARAMITRYPQEYAQYIGRSGFTFNGIAKRNHDPLIGQVEGADGIKTGYTQQAGNSYLGSARRGETRLVMVLAGIENYDNRGALAQELMRWGFDGFDRRTLFEQGATLGRARVQDGVVGSVSLRTAAPVSVAIPKIAGADIETRIEYTGPLRAPLTTDRAVGRLVVQIEDMEPVAFPLYPGQPVAKARPWQRIVNGVQGWFR